MTKEKQLADIHSLNSLLWYWEAINPVGYAQKIIELKKIIQRDEKEYRNGTDIKTT